MTTSCVSPDELPVRLAVVRKLLLERCSETASGRRAAALLERLERRLAVPPRVAILGEANSGKSTLANRLVGFDLLETDLVRNTRVPVRLGFAHAPLVALHDADGRIEQLGAGMPLAGRAAGARLIDVRLPVERLARLEIVDTPALAPDPAVMAAAVRVCRTAHIGVWCTVATQAWRATELSLWSALRRRFEGRSILAVTHAGLLDAADREKVRRRLERDVGGLFRAIVMVEAAADGGALVPEAIVGAVEAMAADVRQARAEAAAAVVRRFADGLEATPPAASDAARRRRPAAPAVVALEGGLAG